ncbi:MAG: helix-turn-helix domain-containing protein [Pseudomonadota bacterium]
MPPFARQSPVPLDACNLAKTIDLIGDRWSLLIIRAALYGVRRFEDFHAELGAPRTVLSGRLKKLTDAGVLKKTPYQKPGSRTRYEYVLTKSGAALQPALIALTQWGDACFGEGPPPISFSRGKRGGRVRAAFVDETGREVSPGQLKITLRK